MGIVAGFKTSDRNFFEKKIDANEYEQNLIKKNEIEHLFIQKYNINSVSSDWRKKISDFIVNNKEDIMKILGE
jgi:hypothetical protein